jgi:DnaJ-class molecular chaperone
MNRSPHEVLGVSRDAPDSDIKRAYRQLSLKYHPDRNANPEAKQRFQEISQAYESLANAGELPAPNNNVNVFHSNAQFNDFIHQMFNNPPLFHNLATGLTSLNIQLEFSITLEQSYNGATIPIEIERHVFSTLPTTEKETFYITLPLGIDTGEFYIIPNKGHQRGQDRGDVRLHIHITPHSVFKRQGLDLIFRKTVSLKEALVGCAFNIPHLNGTQIPINTANSIITPNYMHHAGPRTGMPRMVHQSQTGDIVYGVCLVTYEIEFPRSLSPEQLEGLAKIL